LSAHFSSRAQSSYESQEFQGALNSLISKQKSTLTLIELGGLLKSLGQLSQKMASSKGQSDGNLKGSALQRLGWGPSGLANRKQALGVAGD
jgi:hypothetical protein